METGNRGEIICGLVELKLLYQDKIHRGFWALFHDEHWKRGCIVQCKATNSYHVKV